MYDSDTMAIVMIMGVNIDKSNVCKGVDVASQPFISLVNTKIKNNQTL